MVLTTKNGGVKDPTTTNMHKYLILRDTIANKQRVSVGDIVELDQAQGFDLVANKKAELYKEKPKAKKTNRSVGLKKSETKAVKKRAKK
jgi:hypothetical protein